MRSKTLSTEGSPCPMVHGPQRRSPRSPSPESSKRTSHFSEGALFLFSLPCNGDSTKGDRTSVESMKEDTPAGRRTCMEVYCTFVKIAIPGDMGNPTEGEGSQFLTGPPSGLHFSHISASHKRRVSAVRWLTRQAGGVIAAPSHGLMKISLPWVIMQDIEEPFNEGAWLCTQKRRYSP